MNGKLKFRAWDKRQGKWLWPFPEGFSLLGEVTCFDLIGQQLEEFTPELTALERLNDVDIVQYTGLEDKNGKEIYEGDILIESIYDIPAVYCGEHIFIVVFRCSAFRKVAKDMYATMDVRGKYGEVYQGELMEAYGGVSDTLQNIEVIGNIYENPELINRTSVS